MKKIKQKITQVTGEFNYQNWLEQWSKESIDGFVNKFNHFQITTENSFKNGFKNKTKQLSEIYYAQKAIRLNASEELPFKTLVLLGEKLAQPAYHDDFVKIINDNIIKFKGNFFKLDDLENTSKVQKAIRTFEFKECQEIKKAA